MELERPRWVPRLLGIHVELPCRGAENEQPAALVRAETSESNPEGGEGRAGVSRSRERVGGRERGNEATGGRECESEREGVSEAHLPLPSTTGRHSLEDGRGISIARAARELEGEGQGDPHRQTDRRNGNRKFLWEASHGKGGNRQ